MLRINKFIAQATGASRRKAEDFIKSGRVCINNRELESLSYLVQENDCVTLDGRILEALPKAYYLLNKPVGYTVSRSDTHAERLIIELVPTNPPVFPVGRLDKNSRGLIILTNDGRLAEFLTHPKYEKEKEYAVTVSRDLTTPEIAQLKNGIKIEEERLHFHDIRKIGPRQYSITLREGRKRQIRKMMTAIGVGTEDLNRIRIGNLTDPRLKTGQYRKLKEKEIDSLYG